MTRLLVLGGTRFVGRAVVEDARTRGWEVTTFNRGSQPVPDDVEQVVGDRRDPDGLDALGDRRWDHVVDTWSAEAVAVDRAARALAGRVGGFAYVSSRSVYPFPTPAGADESIEAIAGDPTGGADEDYPQRKAGGEVAATSSFPDALLLRAGLILGPWEDVGRLPWWLDRIAAGGEVPAPGPSDLPLQYVDARDLAAFALDALEAGRRGAHDVVSRPGHTTMGEVLATCREVTGSDATLTWVDPARVAAAGVDPWTDLPLWLPPGDLHDALHGSDPSRALAAGLTPRPVAETVADTWAWMEVDGSPEPREGVPRHGMTADQEARLLHAPT